MRVHVLQHAEGEGLGSLKKWFIQQQFKISTTRVDLCETLPSLDQLDWLVILGGPMGTYEEERYPWLISEKVFIREAIQADKRVLGICLGGQLIANAMGAKVYPNTQKEIGWFPINKTHQVASWLPEQSSLLCWHGDCFDIPQGAVSFATSAATSYQGFCIGPRVWALQFHIEAIKGTTELFYKVTGADLPDSEYVQNLDELASTAFLKNSQTTAYCLLDFMLRN